MGDIITLPKGTTILQEDSMGDCTYRILSGSVQICKNSRRKGNIPLASLGVGEVFGEMYLLDKTGHRSATAIAASDVTLEVVPREELLDKLQTLPADLQSMLGSMSKRLRNTSRNYTLTMAGKKEFSTDVEIP
jgi:CRP-like cAMP-binding protein